MTAKSLFNIILKVLGIYFIKDIVIEIPSLFRVIYEFGNSDFFGGFTTLLFSLATLFIYSIIIYYLIYKTDLVIDKFKLAENVPEDPIPLNIHRSTIICIAILVVGLLMIVQSIPLMIRGLSKWYQYNRATGSFSDHISPFDGSMIWVYVAEIIIGLLLIGNLRPLVNYIELKQRRSHR